MKILSENWFFATIRYTEQDEQGMLKKTTAQYVVNAMTFTECEARIIEECGDCEVTRESIAPFKEVLFSGKDDEKRWYKVKVAFVTLDEKTGKEKKITTMYLVQASSNEYATKNVKEGLTGLDYEISDVVETKVVDVLYKEVKA